MNQPASGPPASLAPVVVLSPHLDDAALSCFAVLAGQGAPRTVVTVFAGVPEPGTPGEWDASHGVGRSDEHMRERVADDLDVMAGLGVAAVHLPLLDLQYRTSGLTARSLARRIEQHVEGADVYAPAGFGGHPDHVLVRDAALRAFTGMASLRLYADLPYAAAHGWPFDCQDGSCERPLRDVLTGVASRARVTGCQHEALTPETASAKMRRLAMYRSQFRLLDGPSGGLRRRAVDRFEAYWTLAPNAGPSGGPSAGRSAAPSSGRSAGRSAAPTAGRNLGRPLTELVRRAWRST